MPHAHSDKAATRGEPGYVWRSGQQRRLQLIQKWVNLQNSTLFDNGCGLGTYLQAFAPYSQARFGLEVEHDRAVQARPHAEGIVEAVGEQLPFPENLFDFILSNEVIEHVANDHHYLAEMVRVVRQGGRIVIFCPNRWHPFEQHGIYWRGKYHFGNIPLVNYLPNRWRNRLAFHVRTYTQKDLFHLIAGLPVRTVHHSYIAKGYDNVVVRFPRLGQWIRTITRAAEKTPLQILCISHFWVLEKIAPERSKL